MKESNTPLSREIADKISHMIINEKKYLPSEKLPNERTFAESLGVSRTSIREAIKILAAKGILTVKRGVGTYVSENPGITLDPLGLSHLKDKKRLLREWFEVRLVLEPEAVKWVVLRATDEEIDEIVAAEKKIRELIEKGEDYTKADQHFHSTLSKATHNEIISRFIPTIEQSINEAIAVSQEGDWFNKSTENALRYHYEIVKFIKMRDEKGASLAMRYHLLQGLEDIEG